jgi:hypothetical protein
METRDILEITSPSLADFRRHLRITSNDLDAELHAKLRALHAQARENLALGRAYALTTKS